MINKKLSYEASSIPLTHSAMAKNGRAHRPQDNQAEKINNVYSMLSKQQQNINSLLSKYMDVDTAVVSRAKPKNQKIDDTLSNDGVYQNYLKSRSRTIDLMQNDLPMASLKLKVMLNKDQKQRTRNSSPNSNMKQSDEYSFSERNKNQGYLGIQKQRNRNQSISLPIIYQKLQKSQKKRTRNKSISHNNYKDQFSYNFRKDKLRMENQLYRIYGQKNSYFTYDLKTQPKSSLGNSRPKKQKRREKNVTAVQSIKNHLNQGEKQQMRELNTKPTPQIQIQSDDESNVDEVQTVYYQRQFRDLMRMQCTQQLNFLYFSKNEQMKDWTDSLLSMIEKHDKEVTSIRKKARYLQTFDDKFFSIGIFNTNDV